MYHMHLDFLSQSIVIEKDGAPVALRTLPTQRVPNPGKEALMALPGNQEAFDAIYDMVAFVNVLPSILAENARLKEAVAMQEPAKIQEPPVV